MTLADVADHLAGEDELMVRFSSGGVSSVASASAWIARNLAQWREGGPVRAFGVCEASTGRLAGTVEANLAFADTRPGVPNVSYAVHPWARGRGFATRAVGLLVGYLRALPDVWAAVIQVDPENVASARVAERAGFRFVGVRVTSENEVLRTFVFRWA